MQRIRFLRFLIYILKFYCIIYHRANSLLTFFVFRRGKNLIVCYVLNQFWKSCILGDIFIEPTKHRELLCLGDSNLESNPISCISIIFYIVGYYSKLCNRFIYCLDNLVSWIFSNHFMFSKKWSNIQVPKSKGN